MPELVDTIGADHVIFGSDWATSRRSHRAARLPRPMRGTSRRSDQADHAGQQRKTPWTHLAPTKKGPFYEGLGRFETKGFPHEVSPVRISRNRRTKRCRNTPIDIEGAAPSSRWGITDQRIRIHARSRCGARKPDVTMATGAYPVPILRPYISGQEAVGIVEEATPGLQHLLGKRVVAFTRSPTAVSPNDASLCLRCSMKRLNPSAMRKPRPSSSHPIRHITSSFVVERSERRKRFSYSVQQGASPPLPFRSALPRARGSSPLQGGRRRLSLSASSEHKSSLIIKRRIS